MRATWLLLLLAGLAGCAAWQPASEQPVVATPPEFQHDTILPLKPDVCVFNDDVDINKHNCELTYWAGVWVGADNTAWPERKAAITELGTSASDKLHKVLLSLPTDTPYQDRLRAKHWLDELLPHFTPQMQQVAATVLASPNNQMLEYESAISVLNKLNTQRAVTIRGLNAELEAQQKKLQELLQIEATMMDKNRSNQQ